MLRLKPNTKEYYGSEETFLFILEPYEKKFPVTLENRDYLFTCKDYFLLGSDQYFLLFSFINQIFFSFFPLNLIFSHLDVLFE